MSEFEKTKEKIEEGLRKFKESLGFDAYTWLKRGIIPDNERYLTTLSQIVERAYYQGIIDGKRAFIDKTLDMSKKGRQS